MQKLQLVYNMYVCFRLCREHTFQLLFQIIYKMEILRKLEMFPICPLITSYMSAKSYSSSKSKVSSKSILLPKVHVCQKCFLMVLPKLTSKSVYNLIKLTVARQLSVKNWERERDRKLLNFLLRKCLALDVKSPVYERTLYLNSST